MHARANEARSDVNRRTKCDHAAVTKDTVAQHHRVAPKSTHYLSDIQRSVGFMFMRACAGVN